MFTTMQLPMLYHATDFYFANNLRFDTDNGYAKVKLLFTYLNEKWQLHFPKSNFLSVDEAMIEYYGRHELKQRIHEKPIRFGYQVWGLCSASGYFVQAELYQGAKTGHAIPKTEMGGLVVADLISELFNRCEYRLYFNNLFASLLLLE